MNTRLGTWKITKDGSYFFPLTGEAVYVNKITKALLLPDPKNPGHQIIEIFDTSNHVDEENIQMISKFDEKEFPDLINLYLDIIDVLTS